MYLLSIQGRYAPAFQLKGDTAIQLKQQLETTTSQHALVISAKFRTDLIYEDEINRLEEFLAAWCHAVDQPYDKGVKLKFFRSDEEAISISQFFYRLHLLRRFPKWYEGYLEKLVNILIQNAHNPLCQKLSEPMEQFCEAIEIRRLKEDHDALFQSINEFIKLKHLATFNTGNCN